MALLSEKTRKFLNGRRGLLARIEKECKGVDNIIWVHSASYGEIEESRPVIEAIRASYPEVKILVTYFSPSGYEYRKDEDWADFVYYLPIDTPRNARRFLDAVRPIRVLVSVSDYWLFFLNEIRKRGIPAYLVSGRFTPEMSYFKPLGFIYRKVFRTCFRGIFVRDNISFELLDSIGVQNVILAGDPRMDRVAELVSSQWSDSFIERWSCGSKVFVGGSTLPGEDDAIVVALANAHPSDKFLIVPHDISEKQIEGLCACVKGKCVRYSSLPEGFENAQVMIVDTVGMLSRIYRYGFASYVGAGFDGAPHSVIEPAAYGCPVSFGPDINTQQHCLNLVSCGGAAIVHNPQEAIAWYDSLTGEALEKASIACSEYCRKQRGVAESIMKEIML